MKQCGRAILGGIAGASYVPVVCATETSLMHRTMYPIIAGNSREGDFRDFRKTQAWENDAYPKLFPKNESRVSWGPATPPSNSSERHRRT